MDLGKGVSLFSIEVMGVGLRVGQVLIAHAANAGLGVFATWRREVDERAEREKEKDLGSGRCGKMEG